MGLFGKKKKDEYEEIYDDSTCNNMDLMELDEDEYSEEYNEYEKIYKVDTEDQFFNGAFDEYGNCVTCDYCGRENLRCYNGQWLCQNCDRIMDRSTFFNHMGAEPPGGECLTCDDNYPLCKRWCHKYKTDPNVSI